MRSLIDTWKRRAAQLASLAVIGEFSYYGVFRCPFAVPYVSCATCPVVQCPGRSLWLTVLIAIAGSALLFGRAFCAWACPAGLVSELLSRVAFLRGKITGAFGAVLGSLRYVVAAAALYALFAMHNPRWAVPIRTGEFIQATLLTFEHAFPYWLIRTGVVVGAIALSLAIPMFWCRYLCPTGALLEPLRKFSLFGYRAGESCKDCGKCARSCAMETLPGKTGCTNCGDCVDSCAKNAVKLRRIGGKSA